MRDYIEDECRRIERELLRLKERAQNVAFECDALGEERLLNYAELMYDSIGSAIYEARRVYNGC